MVEDTQTSHTSPAETLRRAAALMRERAEASIHDSDGESVWRLGSPDCYGNTPTVVVTIPGDPDPHQIAAGCGDQDASHIASWHPAVALAVADWLDVFDGVPNIRDDHPALKVARAYLGESA